MVTATSNADGATGPPWRWIRPVHRIATAITRQLSRGVTAVMRSARRTVARTDVIDSGSAAAAGTVFTTGTLTAANVSAARLEILLMVPRLVAERWHP